MSLGKKIITGSSCLMKISPSELSHLQRVELMILQDVAACCDAHQIPYFLLFGTLLGAVRHQGFIPWDDDVDLGVPISDVEKLISSLRTDFPNKYLVSGLDYGGAEDFFSGLKVELCGTVCVEPGCECFPHIRGINVDIFPIAETPKAFFWRKRRGHRLVFLRRITNSVMFFHHPSENMLKSPDKKIRFFYRTKFLVGLSFSFFSISHWSAIYKRCLYRKYANSNFRCCSDDFGNYCKKGLIFDVNKTRKYSFCGSLFCSVGDYDFFLSACYGLDYLELPPVEKRETHSFVKIDFGNY
jgi:lipopolysaccharide cholinephosphotransferase